jgi:hypothetical protein
VDARAAILPEHSNIPETMSDKNPQTGVPREPAGLGVHNHGPAAEFAQEQGWSTNEEQRVQPPPRSKEGGGGTDYDYGAQDFGDLPKDQGGVQPAPGTVDFLIGNEKEGK